MELHIVLDGRKDLSGQLYRQLRDAIRGGRIGAGERLPPSRLLPDQLGLARKTVAEAYGRLTLVPAALMRAVVTAKHLSDWHNATLNQRALALFLDSGGLTRHIRRCHEVYAGRRERLLQRLAGDLSPWLQAIPTTVGFHLSAWLRCELNVDLLCRLARRVEVGLYPLSNFYASEARRQGLFFGYGAIDSIDIDAALDRLAGILAKMEREA
jgi:GntR family transcriptional regulator/MocR family aminotransferase